MRQAFENMNPGGWIEYMDGTVSVASMDGTVEGTPFPFLNQPNTALYSTFFEGKRGYYQVLLFARSKLADRVPAHYPNRYYSATLG